MLSTCDAILVRSVLDDHFVARVVAGSIVIFTCLEIAGVFARGWAAYRSVVVSFRCSVFVLGWLSRRAFVLVILADISKLQNKNKTPPRETEFRSHGQLLLIKGTMSAFLPL